MVFPVFLQSTQLNLKLNSLCEFIHRMIPVDFLRRKSHVHVKALQL